MARRPRNLLLHPDQLILPGAQPDLLPVLQCLLVADTRVAVEQMITVPVPAGFREIVGELDPKQTTPEELGLYMAGGKRMDLDENKEAI